MPLEELVGKVAVAPTDYFSGRIHCEIMVVLRISVANFYKNYDISKESVNCKHK